jgi:hypothetical protein
MELEGIESLCGAGSELGSSTKLPPNSKGPTFLSDSECWPFAFSNMVIVSVNPDDFVKNTIAFLQDFLIP